MANYQLNVKVNGVEQAVSTVGQLEEALTATKEELKQIEIGSDAFNELTNQARVLQGELDRTFERATNFNSSLTIVTESVTRLGSSIAAGFSLAISSFQLLGDESEELTEAQVKAQQALAIAFSATTIATNASTIATDAKIVADKLALGLTNLITAAVGRETVAKAAQAAATGTATIAQTALNTAMNANPILLLVTAIGALIGALVVFSKDTDKATDSTQDYNEKLKETNKIINDTSKAIEEELKLQRRLTKLKGEIAEDDAKTETEKLKIRLETQKKLDEIDLESIDNQKNNLQQQLDNLKESSSLSIDFITEQYKQLSQIQDFNINQSLTAEQQLIARLTIQYQEDLENKELTEQQKQNATENYYSALFNLQEQQILNDTSLTEEERKLALERFTQARELQRQLNLLAEERKIVVKEQAFAEKQSQEEIARVQKENIKKRKEALEEFNNDVEDLTRDRIEKLQELEREFQDILIQRISRNLVDGQKLYENIAKASEEATKGIVNDTEKVADGVEKNVIKSVEEFIKIYQETGQLPPLVAFDGDIIAELDQQITELKVSRDRALTDAELQFNQEVEAFKKAGKEKGISDSQINAEIAKLREQFDNEQLQRTENFNAQIVETEQEKADKIADIDRVLKNELTFGDNSFADNRNSLLLESIDFEIQQSERRISIQRGYNVEEIKLRQSLEAEKRKVLRDSLLEQQRIELEEALKNVQGTEEQKGEQRERLIKLYNKRVGQINEDFRTSEQEAEKSNTDEINSYKLAKFEEFSNVAFELLNGILGFAAGLNEIRQVETENALNALRDFTAQQTSILNESYNQDLANLEARYAAGLISQEQYNSSVSNLQQTLDADTAKLEKQAANRELTLQKEAFERKKKLDIAQSIVSGLQGAVQAFASAFQLGPIVGPVVGGILSALVLSTTATQVAAIKKTKFDGGEPSITAANAASSAGGLGASNVGTQGISSSGGLTTFSPDLVGRPESTTQQTVDNVTQERYQKVYVLESDITNIQQRVEVAESSATFG